ncbi:hypothetical protein HNR39_003583 [Glaciimonas immobilis]|uniref:Uncharacterized protein n=1 Tax=Glaciimonas immobilis TaxID=728004 RepID=A0A840RV53_9BURK|nr:hypothetical protein [Glaciimonas immobilis]
MRLKSDEALIPYAFLRVWAPSALNNFSSLKQVNMKTSKDLAAP